MKPEEAKNKQLEQVLNDNELEEATGGVEYETTSWDQKPLYTGRGH